MTERIDSLTEVQQSDERRDARPGSPGKSDDERSDKKQEAGDSKAEARANAKVDEKDPGKGKKKSRLPLILLGVAVALAAIGGGVYWFMTRDQESTDDAYTEGRAVTIAPRVQGYVTELRVDDNQFLRAGDLILRIDPRDYTTARDQAQAQLELARAQLQSARLDLEVARVRYPADLQQAEAQQESARANQAQAQSDYRRQRAVDPRATTQTSIDTATATLTANTASAQSAEAQVQIASLVQQQIALAEATVDQRRAQVDQAQAQLAQAEVNLSYTELRAPQDGRVTRRNVERGGYLSAGASVMSLVTPEVWITANFKENQLDRMRPGQAVEIEVDAYPDLVLHGRVDSIQMGSGARFSAFPAENATGNWVKIVRRVPVKIVIERGLDPDLPLPLGLSVTPTVTLR